MARQFTQDEAKRIFARAAERQHSGPTIEEGLTLEELQAVGRSAGIDPEHVAAAAAEAATPYEPLRWQGVPLRSRVVRRLPGPVTDAAWVQVLDVLRARHQTPGVVEVIGERRTWTVHEGSLHGETVRFDAHPGGAGLTIDSRVAPERAMTYALGVPVGLLGVLVGAMWLADGEPKQLGFALVMLLVSVLITAVSSVTVRRRARARPARLDALADRIEQIVRADEASDRAGVSEEALSDALDPTTAPLTRYADAEPPASAPPPRTRTRS